jgi:hypothetical protein
MFRFLFVAASTVANVTFATGALPATANFIATATFTPGAFTKIIVDQGNVKTGGTAANAPAWAVRPGYENAGSLI